MQLIKLVVESGYHVLNLRALFLSVKFLYNRSFQISRGSRYLVVTQLSLDVFVLKHIVDGNILILLQQLKVPIINQLQGLFIHASLGLVLVLLLVLLLLLLTLKLIIVLTLGALVEVSLREVLETVHLETVLGTGRGMHILLHFDINVCLTHWVVRVSRLTPD